MPVLVDLKNLTHYSTVLEQCINPPFGTVHLCDCLDIRTNSWKLENLFSLLIANNKILT